MFSVNTNTGAMIALQYLNKTQGALAQNQNAINTGMRKNEILALTWERGDLAKDLGFNARITLYDTKNGEPRGIPLNKAAIAALTSIEPDAEQQAGRVFKRRNGEDWGQIRTAFENAVERAGLPDFRFHDLWHTAASHLAMRGSR